MTNSIKEHIPGFVSGVEPRIGEFNSVEELLNISWVKSKKSSGGKFTRYSIDIKTLMVEYNDHTIYRIWYVVGFIENIDGLDLPKFMGSRGMG